MEEIVADLHVEREALDQFSSRKTLRGGVMEQALSGTRVLDLTHYIAGPYCTKLLADSGADVIKIEKPGEGDGARRMGPFFQDEPHPEKSGLFLYLNTSKRGITLNLDTETGRKLLKEMAKEADVVVESFSPGVMAGWDLSYEALESINAKLVMTSVSNFGQTGPYRDYKSPHIVTCAIGGWTQTAGDQTRERPQAGGWVTHYVTGIIAATGTLSALFYRNETGIGQYVDISAMEAMSPIMVYPTVYYSQTGQVEARPCNRFPNVIVPCKDGYIGLNLLTQSQWELLCAFVGMPELLENPDYAYGPSLLEHSEEVLSKLAPWFLDKNANDVFHEGESWRIPFALLPTTREIMEFPQHKERGFFVDVDHPATGKVTYPGAPFKMSETPQQISCHAPLLGEHNEEVYCKELGYSRNDLVRLSELGVI